MAETLILPAPTGDRATDRQAAYDSLIPQLDALLTGETDLTANLANTAAALREAFGFFWVGFYLTKDDQLVLGPFQGPIACTRIAFGRGVCGAAYSRRETILVPDVEQFPGHIACSSASKSEVVVPVFDALGNVAMVLDVDSDLLNDFDDIDVRGLEQVAALLTARL
ncbi:GAF domain-containing protein [Spirosoma rhododendri]|uniref:GAF domain-containing protein n=1 Tax=Spirosoma rhododendri TaxID=2728024 RepID=A0A7L5DLY5_9BACT|nr:GAF domain-containing protein [Spirosoma rhododendri]QJD78213.1 GAF domain-containing protein [Spirosoma rhododendri]